jgi:hypothetical protein
MTEEGERRVVCCAGYFMSAEAGLHDNCDNNSLNSQSPTESTNLRRLRMVSLQPQPHAYQTLLGHTGEPGCSG